MARNHVDSSFLERLPTVKLVYWDFLGLGNYDNTNNSVNSKNLYILLLVLSTINLYFKGSLMNPWLRVLDQYEISDLAVQYES